MKMTKEDYSRFVERRQPRSPLGKDLLLSFAVGGLICCAGEAVQGAFVSYGLGERDAGAATSVLMVFLGALLTGLGVYDSLAKHAGGGTLVPITGFANSVVSPALEYKAEGFIPGTAVKIFSIAGPVIVFGLIASIVYGLGLALFGLA